ncbi:MAG TPA: hypothetical protein VGJ30_19740 [Candidatus Angelobacter sp.]
MPRAFTRPAPSGANQPGPGTEALGNLAHAVILSGTERHRSDVESKDPENASFTMLMQGVLSKPRF